MEPHCHPGIARARAVTGSHRAPARASGDVAESGSSWEFLVARDATAAALLGPATAAGEAEAVRRQVEALTDRGGFTHWWDPRLAKSWAARAVELTSDTERRRLDGVSYEEQLAAVRSAWEALSNCYRALNIPWMIDPAARRLYTTRTSAADSREWCDAGEWGDAAARFDPGPYIGTEDGGRPCVRTHIRITLDTESRVADYLRADELNRETWPTWGALEAGSIREWTWHAYAWRFSCAQRTTLGACERWRSDLFPPLIWFFDLAQDIARSLHTRGPMRVLAEATRAAFILNVKSAHAAGVLSSAIGDAAANRLAGLSAVQVEEAHIPDETADEVAGAIAGVAPLAAAIPGVGTVIAAVTGCVAAAVVAFNRLFAAVRAVQRDVDAWGRDRPVFERTYLTGGATRSDRPTHDVPAPSGWRRESSPLVLGYIPTMEVVEAAKRSEAEQPPHASTPSRRAQGVPLPVLLMGVAAVVGVVALVTRDRWAESVRGR